MCDASARCASFFAWRPLRIGHPLLCGFGIGDLTIGRAIDVVEGHHVAEAAGKDDQPLRHIRQNSLPPLIVRNVSLGTPKATCQIGLGYIEAFADGFDAAHAWIIAVLRIKGNSSACCFSKQHR